MVGELEATAPDSPRGPARAEVIRRNVELEARLIDDLLDVTRIWQRQTAAQPRDGKRARNPAARLRDLPRGHSREEPAHGVPAARPRPRTSKADPARLQQVFWNLIKNSVKFTPDNGRIIIEHVESARRRRSKSAPPTRASESSRKKSTRFSTPSSRVKARSRGASAGSASASPISKAMVDAHGGTSGRGERRTRSWRDLHRHAADRRGPGAQPERGNRCTAGRCRSAEAAAGRSGRFVSWWSTITTTPVIGMKMMLERRGYRVTVAHSAEEAVTKTGAGRLRPVDQ